MRLSVCVGGSVGVNVGLGVSHGVCAAVVWRLGELCCGVGGGWCEWVIVWVMV